MANRRDYKVLDGFKYYHSGVQLIYQSCNRRVWNLGSSVVCKESPITPSETPFDEEAIVDFLQDHTTIPIPRVITEWTDEEMNTHFIIKEKIKGESLDQLWPTMSWELKDRMADETAAYLRQLRELTSPYCGRVDNQGVVDQMLFNLQYPIPQGPFHTQDELWNAMVATLNNQIPQKALDRLRVQMPECLPWTFTHGDLSLSNIIVRNDHVVGILDWEWSGWFPRWWEYAKFRGGVPRWIDSDWWELLEHRMDRYPEAYEFWDKFHSLVHKVESLHRSMDPRKIRMGNTVLEELFDDGAGVSLG